MGSTTFRHAFYLVRDVRVADIRVAWLVYLACLRSHILRPYCNLESKQANSIYLGDAQINIVMERQSVEAQGAHTICRCVTDCYFIVNVLYLLFASSIAIYHQVCIEITVR